MTICRYANARRRLNSRPGEFGPRILDLMRGVPWSVWQTLDEKPGLFGYMDDRFYILRRVRNDREWGSKLFADLRK
jgi:hypothetical protein